MKHSENEKYEISEYFFKKSFVFFKHNDLLVIRELWSNTLTRNLIKILSSFQDVYG